MSDPEKSLFRGIGVFVALAGGGLLVVLLAVAGLGLRGFGGDEDAAPTAPTSPTTGTSAPTTTATGATVPRAPVERDPSGGVEVSLHRRIDGTYALTEPVVDALPARSVLRITATGFEPNARGLVEQCTVAGCANSFPVLFDDDGRARFQYFVSDAFARQLDPTSKCRASEPPCVVQLRSNEEAAFLTTVFHDRAPEPRRVTVDPIRGGLVEGAAIQVSVEGFVPGERVQAMLCAAPATHGSEWCGAPGPVAPFTVGPDGTGRTALVIATGRVGSAGASCGRGDPCAIVVANARSAVPGAVLPVAFAAGRAARYNATRALTGLAIAIVLFALATFLARTTDWRKPTEADTPDLDQAVWAD